MGELRLKSLIAGAVATGVGISLLTTTFIQYLAAHLVLYGAISLIKDLVEYDGN